jgi:hypothetical protein
MNATRGSNSGSADGRIDEVTSLLATAILRLRLRRLDRRNATCKTRERELELVASSRTHGSRNGERA